MSELIERVRRKLAELACCEADNCASCDQSDASSCLRQAELAVDVVLEAATGATCFGCEHGWPVGYQDGDLTHFWPMHRDPQTGNLGHQCGARQIRALR